MNTYIGIVGSRRRDTGLDESLVLRTLSSILKYPLPQNERNKIILVSGGCPKGADRFAENISEEYIIPMIIHDPDNKKKGWLIAGGMNPRLAFTKVAYERNERIAKSSDILIAVVAKDRKGGTENTIQHFCKKHKKTEQQLIEEGKLILV